MLWKLSRQKNKQINAENIFHFKQTKRNKDRPRTSGFPGFQISTQNSRLFKKFNGWKETQS